MGVRVQKTSEEIVQRHVSFSIQLERSNLKNYNHPMSARAKFILRRIPPLS